MNEVWTVLLGKPFSIVALVVPVVSGCAGIMTPPEPGETWYVTPKPGSTVEVRQTLSADGGARISLQYGKAVSPGDLYKLDPYCQFHVLRPGDELNEPLRIEPDTFTVEETYRRKDVVKLDGMQYAFAAGEDFDPSPSQRTMATYMELSSDAQPDVYQLVCQRWADPYDHNHVSINEMRESLGDLVLLVTN